MRGAIVIISGILSIAAIVMVAGWIVEPLTEVVTSSAAVQEQGWDSHAENIQETVLRWAVLIFLAGLGLWAGLWAIRRERTTGFN